ncbi:MAG TPA: V-type ATPase 116kDa subunit family protein, partial [Oscillospiraceae bacterium]|nr:V-type ATPase 116kDa subunit family protein [Oscillospiraceae bacterium]
TVPAATEVGALKERVYAVCPESEVFVVSSDRTQHYLEIICFKTAVTEVTGALREFAFSAASFSGLSDTAKESIAAGEAHLAKLAKERESLAAEAASFAPQRAELKLCADRLRTKLGQAEATDKLLEDDAVILFNGWVPVPDLGRLEKFLGGRTCAWELSDPDMEKLSEIPIKLKNNKLTAPYNLVTGMYSLPAYNGLDANPFVMPAFALFFGIMFADMAYGLIMLIAGLTILRKTRPRGGVKNLAGMMVQCGITTFIMGFFTGSLFGDAVPVVGTIFGQTWTLIPTFGAIHIGSLATIDLPLNLLEGNNPLYVLVAAMCIGIVHLALGVGLGVYLKVKDGQWLDALLNDVSWWIMFVGLALNFLGHGKTVLYVGIVMMLAGAVLGGKGFGRITGVIGAVYNGVTGYLGDILSYSRLMALMLAGNVIASVFNRLGSLGGIFLFIPVFLIGHTLNFGLNIIGCFVHTMRLQFLEFFSKWYRDGGRPFKPLTLQTNYVDIKED